MSNLSASLIFSGYSDYWSGASNRGRGGGCAFAYYDADTTLKDIVDQWVEDSWSNEYDFEDCPESVTSDDIRDCIIESLTESGRADYDSGALCEWAAYCEETRTCRECNAPIGEEHDEDCEYYEDDELNDVEPDDCEDYNDCCESPQVILWIDWSDHPDYEGSDE